MDELIDQTEAALSKAITDGNIQLIDVLSRLLATLYYNREQHKDNKEVSE